MVKLVGIADGDITEAFCISLMADSSKWDVFHARLASSPRWHRLTLFESEIIKRQLLSLETSTRLWLSLILLAQTMTDYLPDTSEIWASLIFNSSVRTDSSLQKECIVEL